MGESYLSDIELIKSKDGFSQDEAISINVKFSVLGAVRESFNEKNWTQAYDSHDTNFKIKYGIKLLSGGFRKHEIGKPIDSYRKASIFWTRNPKLVNPMKERRIWVQVAKNFEPFIRLSEQEVQEELFDFDEKFTFKASQLGSGNHKIAAEVFVSWQKHNFSEPENPKKNSQEIEITIN